MSSSMSVTIVTVRFVEIVLFRLKEHFLNLGTVEIERLDTIAGTFAMMFTLLVLFVYYYNNINVFAWVV